MMEVLGVLLIPLGLLFITLWCSKDLSGHRWVYRNPYTRTCEACGRQEDMHCWASDLHKPGRGWWEVMRPGAGKKCNGGTPGGDL